MRPNPYGCDICKKPIANHKPPLMLQVLVQQIPGDEGTALEVDHDALPPWLRALVDDVSNPRIVGGLSCMLAHFKPVATKLVTHLKRRPNSALAAKGQGRKIPKSAT